MSDGETMRCVGGPCEGQVYVVSPGVAELNILQPRPMRPHDLAYDHTNATLPNIPAARYLVQRRRDGSGVLVWEHLR